MHDPLYKSFYTSTHPDHLELSTTHHEPDGLDKPIAPFKRINPSLGHYIHSDILYHSGTSVPPVLNIDSSLLHQFHETTVGHVSYLVIQERAGAVHDALQRPHLTSVLSF